MHAQEQTPIVVIQTVIVGWTKQSRGGKAAQVRNQVPEQLELPPTLPAPTSTVARQCVIYDEYNQFRSPIYQRWLDQSSVGSEPIAVDLYEDRGRLFVMPRLLLSASDGLLRVGFDWMRFDGAPRRFPKIDRYTLKSGEWVQLRCNARSSEDWTWAYLKLVVNVSYTASFTPTLFCASTPTYQRLDMADLW